MIDEVYDVFDKFATYALTLHLWQHYHILNPRLATCGGEVGAERGHADNFAINGSYKEL